MKKILLILSLCFVVSCGSSLRDSMQQSLNAVIVGSQPLGQVAVSACNIAELTVLNDTSLTTERKSANILKIREKCDAIYDAIDELVVVEEAAQSAIDNEDLTTLQKLIKTIIKCIAEIRKMIDVLG